MNLISIFLAACISVFSVIEAGEKVRSIPCDPDFITTDKLGNLYIITSDEIVKYDRDGKELYRFSDKSLSNISSVDANNALKLVVFYGDLSMIAILDNTLSIHGEPISLVDKNFDQVTLVCRSQRDKLWLYDQENMEILQTDLNMNITARTGNLTQLLSLDLNPTFMVEQKNQLFVGDPENGILVFDNFGTYLKKVPIKCERFQVQNKTIIYKKEGSFVGYNQTLFTESVIPVKDVNIQHLRIEENRVFSGHSTGVNIYSEN